MKNIIVFIMLWALSNSYGDVYEDLDQHVKRALDRYKNQPSQEQLEQIEKSALEMIRLDEQDYRGYLYLSTLYLASRDIVGNLEARERSVEAINKYQKLDDFPGKIDFSEYQTYMQPLLESAKSEKQRRVREEERAQRQALPAMEKVREARELTNGYHQNRRAGDLEKAMELLTEVISSDPIFWEAYVELSNIYGIKAEYEKQLAMWQIAVHFGDISEIQLKSCTVNLRYDAMNYEVNNDVTLENPGPSPGLFFIWLNRDLVESYLPDEKKEEIEALTVAKKERRAERIKRWRSGATLNDTN